MCFAALPPALRCKNLASARVLFSGIGGSVIINPGDYRRALRLSRLYSKRGKFV
ncbi:hypothetical protein KCP71_06460 [Salmonella enterica subsp. enterica]|nr:hypothetical protein KCP71_06460 [Salmonella enterica subsp. enterica]